MPKEARPHNRGKTVSSINGARKTEQLRVKTMGLEYSLVSYTKIISKWIKEIKCEIGHHNP